MYVVAYMFIMPPVTIYLPADLMDAARKQAREGNRSLSAWVTALVREATATEWPRGFVDLLRHGNGDLVEPADPPHEDVETFR